MEEQVRTNRLQPALSFVVLCAVSLVLWFRPLLDTLGLATSNSKYTQILLILPLSAALILQSWRTRRPDLHGWLPAAGILAASLLLFALATWGLRGQSSDEVLALKMSALVAWWIASFAFSFGLAAARESRFPLLFLLWMIPIPGFALDPITVALQRGSTIVAQELFSLFRVPVLRQGTTLFIPGLDIDVTVECSSIRSSLILMVTTMLLAQVLLRTPWRKLLVIVCAVPLSVAKNGLRIFVIGMLATKVDAAYLTGRLHHQGGVVFFLIALAVVLLLLWILRRGEDATRSAEADRSFSADT